MKAALMLITKVKLSRGDFATLWTMRFQIDTT